MSFLKSIPTWVYWTFGALVILAGVVAVVVVLLQRAKKKKEEDAKNALPPGAPEDPATQIPRVFAAGRKLIESKVSDKTTRDGIPRLLVMGETGSGKTTLLNGSGMGTPFGVPCDPPLSEPAACRLWFFDGGVAVDATGAVLMGDLGKREPDAPHYKRLLRELKNDRPGRPLDGLLLTIPCRDLLPGASTPEERKRKATILHKRILEAQAELGMSVPIYVLVTQCDLVTGFTSFGNEVSQALKQSMLGWSSSAEPDSETVEDWVGEAFTNVHGALLKEQSRRFASEGRVRHPDSFFLFPSELHGVAEPLSAYIDEIFIPTAVEAPLMLRGIYFCGDLNATTLMAPQSMLVAPGMPTPVAPTLAMEAIDSLPGGGSGPQIVFVKDLFDKKIFPEKNIGKPSKGAVARRDRSILGIQIGAVVLSLFFAVAVAISADHIRTEAETIMPFLTHLASSVNQIAGETEAGDPTGQNRMDRARKMLDRLALIESDHLRTTFIPGSWVSSLDSRIEDAMALGYERSILYTYGRQLDIKVKDLISDNDPRSGADAAEVGFATSLEKTPEFIRLEAWLSQVSAFEAQASNYNALVDPDDDVSAKDIQQVADLAEYTLIMFDEKGRPTSYKVPPSFFSNSKFYRDALGHKMSLPKFSFEKYRQDARAKSDRMFDALYSRMLDVYKDATIRDVIAALKKGLEDLQKGGDDYKVEQLRALYDTIVRAEGLLSETNLAWVATAGLPDNPGLKRLLDAVRESRLLGPDVQLVKQEVGETKLKLLKAELETATAEIGGQILARDKTGAIQMKLSTSILALKDPLKALLSQGFMSGEDGVPPPEDRDREVMTWNVEVLKDTAKLPKQYDEFNANGGFKPFPDSVRDTLLALSLRKLNAKILGGVGRSIERAEVPLSDNAKVREANARIQISNYAQAGAPLREIVLALGRLQQGTTQTRLRGLVTAQGNRLLGLAWNVFSNPEAYGIKQDSFAWWDGDGAPVFEAFDIADNDAAGLAEKIVSQRVRVDTLGKELADPVLSVLESGEIGSSSSIEPVVVEWHDVVRPMRDYETQKPGNSVGALERFLLNVMPGITFENCLIELEKASSETSSSDFFTRKKASLRRELRNRCEYLAKDNVADKYATLRRVFARSLAERFPFAKTERGVRREDAAPDAVKRFLEDSADFRKRYRGFLSKRGTSADREVVRFLDKMDSVRSFLLPMWGQSEAASDGVFDVRVDFRVNQAREVGGNQIAEWKLRFAQEKLVAGEVRTTAARWHLNDTVTLELRWAKNGPNVPRSDREGGVSVQQGTKTAKFEEYGVWALLRMIAAHQTTLQDVLGKADATSHVLAFEVPTEPDNTGGFLDRVGTDTGVARVFIRMSLSEADKDKLLKYPEFPTVAPAL